MNNMKVYEVLDKSKTYNNIKSSQKTLQQRYFRTENQNGVEREDLKSFLRKSLLKSSKDKDKSISISCYFENLGWLSGGVFNVDSPDDLSIYEEEYSGENTETGKILSFIIYYYPKKAKVI